MYSHGALGEEPQKKELLNRMTFFVRWPQLTMQKHKNSHSLHTTHGDTTELMQMENIYRNNFNYDGVTMSAVGWYYKRRREKKPLSIVGLDRFTEGKNPIICFVYAKKQPKRKEQTPEHYFE